MGVRAWNWTTGMLVLTVGLVAAQDSRRIPRTWDDEEVARHEVPLARPEASPKHVSSDYYYRIPVRPIYKSYPVYAYGHEPPGYLEWLRQQEPVVIWDDNGRRPPLRSDADWLRAGELVFDAPLVMNATVAVDDVRDERWLGTTLSSPLSSSDGSQGSDGSRCSRAPIHFVPRCHRRISALHERRDLVGELH